MQAVIPLPFTGGVQGAFQFLAKRHLPALERATDASYERIGAARATLQDGQLRIEGIHTARLHGVLGLDAPVHAVERHFTKNPLLGPLWNRFGPVLVPGCWCPFELSVRAILGQQVSVAAARTIAGRMVDRWGSVNSFPSADTLAEAPLEEVGIIRQRASTIRSLAQAVCNGWVRFENESTDELRQIRGIGDWTAQYIAMRAFRDPDAFPAADLILRRAAGCATTKELLRMAEAWRPWRAYAVMLLWRSA
jgi:AraC family transcriptional regulator of adaptative response / DNA-3-methyladenine glycosylase II